MSSATPNGGAGSGGAGFTGGAGYSWGTMNNGSAALAGGGDTPNTGLGDAQAKKTPVDYRWDGIQTWNYVTFYGELT